MLFIQHPRLKNLFVSREGIVLNKFGNELKPFLPSNTETLKVNYTRESDKLRTCICVAKLVAEIYVPNDNPRINQFIAYKDNNPLNVKASNLFWVDKVENFKRKNKIKGKIFWE